MVQVDPLEVTFQPIRAQGAGGQNVNKVASAVHLRFDIRASSLPEAVKQRLLALQDARITEAGVVVIKAQTRRTLELNRQEGLQRLNALVQRAAKPPQVRHATRPTQASKRRRLDGKRRRAALKAARRGIGVE